MDSKHALSAIGDILNRAFTFVHGAFCCRYEDKRESNDMSDLSRKQAQPSLSRGGSGSGLSHCPAACIASVC